MDHLVFDSETGEVSINGIQLHNVKSLTVDYAADQKGLVNITINMLGYAHSGTEKSKVECIDSTHISELSVNEEITEFDEAEIDCKVRFIAALQILMTVFPILIGLMALIIGTIALKQ